MLKSKLFLFLQFSILYGLTILSSQAYADGYLTNSDLKKIKYECYLEAEKIVFCSESKRAVSRSLKKDSILAFSSLLMSSLIVKILLEPIVLNLESFMMKELLLVSRKPKLTIFAWSYYGTHSYLNTNLE